MFLYIIDSVSHNFHLNRDGCRSLSYVWPVNTLEKYDDSDDYGDNCPLKIRHDVDNGDDDDDEGEEDGVNTLNHGIVWMSSRFRILWSISLQNLIIVIISNHHCLQFFSELKSSCDIHYNRRIPIYLLFAVSHNRDSTIHFLTIIMANLTILWSIGSEMSSILTIIIKHHHYCQAHLRMVFVAGSEMGTSGGNSRVSLQFITWEGNSSQIRWVRRRM